MRKILASLILLLALTVCAAAQDPQGASITLKAAFGGTCCVPGQLVWAERVAPFRVEGDDLGPHNFTVIAVLEVSFRRLRVNYVDTNRLWFTIPGNITKPLSITVAGPGFSETIDLTGNVSKPAIRNEGYYRHPLSSNLVGDKFTTTIALPDGGMFVFALTIYGSGFGTASDWFVEVVGPVSDTVPARAFPFSQPFGTETLVLLLPRIPNGTYTLRAFEAGNPQNTTATMTVTIISAAQ